MEEAPTPDYEPMLDKKTKKTKKTKEQKFWCHTCHKAHKYDETYYWYGDSCLWRKLKKHEQLLERIAYNQERILNRLNLLEN